MNAIKRKVRDAATLKDNAPTFSKNKISVIIITLNEAHNISACLKSVRSLADEIIVVDSGSQDGTQAICRSLGVLLIETDWHGFGPQKNCALQAADGDWILSIDADERVTPPLGEEIKRAIQTGDADVYEMPRQSNYCGQWMHYSGWYPDYVTRLFRKNIGRFSEDLIHERVITPANAVRAKLVAPLLHYSFRDFSEVLYKINRYSTDGAQQATTRGQSGSLRKALLHGAWAFIRAYFIQRGFLDGKMGFILAVSNAEGVYYRYLKLMLLKARERESAIQN